MNIGPVPAALLTTALAFIFAIYVGVPMLLGTVEWIFNVGGTRRGR